MKILLSWLKDYIDINETPEKIAEALTMTGLEVEEIIQPGKNIKGVVVGKILTKDAHPDSDHLTLCTVDVGQGEPLQIVCGAKNHKAGDVVPVAMIGAKLPSGFEISKAKMRGVDSFGMLCSKSELGLAAESSGLYILPQDLKLGEDIVKALKLDESEDPTVRDIILSLAGKEKELVGVLNKLLSKYLVEYKPYNQSELIKSAENGTAIEYSAGAHDKLISTLTSLDAIIPSILKLVGMEETDLAAMINGLIADADLGNTLMGLIVPLLAGLPSDTIRMPPFLFSGVNAGDKLLQTAFVCSSEMRLITHLPFSFT